MRGELVQFRVLGMPAPKGSSRAFVNRSTGKAHVAPSGSAVNQERLQSWSTAVREAATRAVGKRTEPMVVRQPISVAIEFRMMRPASHWSKRGGVLPSKPPFPAVKPDIDKLARTTLDAMTGTVFDDDSRIAGLALWKVWAQPGEEGALITVGLLD